MQIFQYKKERIDAILTMQTPCQTHIRDFFYALFCSPDLKDIRSLMNESNIQTRCTSILASSP